ncbi:MAG: protein-L-isoaspartate(D-aspartate) O-methyltransferase [Methanomassiliicoccales archaeon]|jgi:protein-L-isoaspartate(D-aspartate) O-methyltransferase
MELEGERERMVGRLETAGVIRDARVRKAMLAVERHLFLPDSLREVAYIDRPLDIGFGQTISAPHMVAIMASLLDLSPGMKVLEVGGGSGYHAAIIADLVRPDGKVYSIETIEGLAKAAKANLARSGHDDVVEIIVGDGSKGLPEKAPFDRISVAAAAPEVPRPLVEQLADGGILLVPVGGAVSQELVMVRRTGDKIMEKQICGVMFVPLVGEHGHKV